MDNYFQNCPPTMADGGRHLGDYKTATRRNEYIKYINDIWRDDQYRLFLQNNSKEILDKEWDYHKSRNMCWENSCVHKYPTRSLPKHFIQERLAYDSIYDLNTRDKYRSLRRCDRYPDYRMTSDDVPLKTTGKVNPPLFGHVLDEQC